MSDENNPLDDQQIEAMLAPLRKPTKPRSRLRPLVIGLSFMAVMLIALVLSLPKKRTRTTQDRGGPVATCGNGKVEPGEDCEPPLGTNCGAACLDHTPAPQQEHPAEQP